MKAKAFPVEIKNRRNSQKGARISRGRGKTASEETMKACNTFYLSGTILESYFSHGRGTIVLGTSEYESTGRVDRSYTLFTRKVELATECKLYQHCTALGHFEYVNEHYRENLPGEIKLVVDEILECKRLISSALSGADESEEGSISVTEGCAFESKNIWYASGTVTFLRKYSDTFCLLGVRVRNSAARNRTSGITVAVVGRAAQLASIACLEDEVLMAGILTKRTGRHADDPAAYSILCRDIEFLSHDENGVPAERASRNDNAQEKTEEETQEEAESDEKEGTDQASAPEPDPVGKDEISAEPEPVTNDEDQEGEVLDL